MSARRYPRLIGLDPIAGDTLLRFAQAYFTTAHHFVNDPFKLVFLFCRPLTVTRLRPKVVRVSGVAADVERYQVIHLVMARIGVGVVVLAKLLALESIGVFFIGSDRVGIASDTHG